MIVCHCQNITDHDIHAAVDWMRASDAETIITPGKIYHALGKRAECGACMPLFLSAMRCNDNLEVPATLRNLRVAKTKDSGHEGRRKGHRLSQRGTAQ
ncbi:(2Fe-2S)-binding protein [Tropicimonas marinistellae]|uniref:(2Fe-2S)-binding protein n=1 Tax=Tropicimonas marinistellae TaxID=1739787 RepID=UPI00098FB501|nr:(2Fe-2S)-binding protein [Tropicimonas marinistellae]